MFSLDDLKDLLGNDEIQTYQARLVRTVRDTVNPDLKQITIGVIGISKDYHDMGGDWERLDCDIIIVPRKAYKCKDSIKQMRLDQATMSLSDDEAWKEKKIQIN